MRSFFPITYLYILYYTDPILCCWSAGRPQGLAWRASWQRLTSFWRLQWWDLKDGGIISLQLWIPWLRENILTPPNICFQFPQFDPNITNKYVMYLYIYIFYVPYFCSMHIYIYYIILCYIILYCIICYYITILYYLFFNIILYYIMLYYIILNYLFFNIICFYYVILCYFVLCY